MDINNIEEIRYRGNRINIVLDIGFDDDRANIWELIEPHAIVEYSNGIVNRVDLIDKGMKVHAFDFNDDEINQIEKYLNDKKIL